MSTIAERLTQLNTIKSDIKTAINNKGGEVGDDFSTYANAINNLSAGGSSGNDSYWSNFFEYKIQKGTSYENLNYLFGYSYIKDENAKNLIENLDVSNVKSMRYTFTCFGNPYYTPGNTIKDLDLTKWNVSNCKNFYCAFDQCYLDSINISGWDFSKNTENSYIFSYSKFKTINMSNCNMSTMNSLYQFFNSSAFVVSIDITGCNTSNVKDMNGLFYGCTKLTTVTGYLDLSNLTNGFYPGTYSNPVYGCYGLETLYLKNIYKDCTMTNDSKWCINLKDTVIKDECLISIISELPDLVNDKGLTATDKIILTLPPSNTLTQEQVQVAIDKGWSIANTTY